MGLVVRDDGWRMPEWLWQRIEPLIPEPLDRYPLGCHRPRVPNRAAMDAILLVPAHRDAVERARCDGDLLVELGAPALSGVGAGGRVRRDLAWGPA